VTTLRHAIKIAASPKETFRALSEVGRMKRWHVGGVEGAVIPGKILYLVPVPLVPLVRTPGLRFGWRTDVVVPGERIVQTCVEGPGSSPGRTLAIGLSRAEGGLTKVELTDGLWEEGDPYLAFCDVQWIRALNNLKAHLESRAISALARHAVMRWAPFGG
jgi:hypothetical protein